MGLGHSQIKGGPEKRHPVYKSMLRQDKKKLFSGNGSGIKISIKFWEYIFFYFNFFLVLVPGFFCFVFLFWANMKFV